MGYTCKRPLVAWLAARLPASIKPDHFDAHRLHRRPCLWDRLWASWFVARFTMGRKRRVGHNWLVIR